MKTSKNIHIIYLTIIALSLAAGVFAYRHAQESLTTKKGTPIIKAVIDIGETAQPSAFFKNISKEKQEALSDLLVTGMRNYDERPCKDFYQGHYRQFVYGVTEDKQQALVGHGCGATGYEKSFIIKQNGTWKKVGFTGGITFKNQDNVVAFDSLTGLPLCSVVEKYSIQKSIAPICADSETTDEVIKQDTKQKYIVR